MKPAFPHYLTRPEAMRGEEQRMVTNEEVDIGDIILSHYNKQTGERVDGIVSEIIEQRPAKGDWSGWDGTPTFYHVKINQL